MKKVIQYGVSEVSNQSQGGNSVNSLSDCSYCRQHKDFPATGSIKNQSNKKASDSSASNSSAALHIHFLSSKSISNIDQLNLINQISQ